MRVPAFCDSCGTIFPSAIEVVNSINVELHGRSGPCPRCGGEGHIPDGVYNFVGNTIELLSGPSRTIFELERLAAILREARERGASWEQINKRIQDEVSELSSIKDILPKSRSELYAFIAIIIAIISLILGQLKSNAPSKIEINQVFNTIYQQQSISELIRPQTSNFAGKQLRPHQTKKKKVGRNELCPCGSGKKYKKCCLNKN